MLNKIIIYLYKNYSKGRIRISTGQSRISAYIGNILHKLELLFMQFEKIRKNLEKLPANDPEILINDSIIKMIPNYGNFSFVSNIFPALAVIFLFWVQNDPEVNLLTLLMALIALYLIINQLDYNNRVVIDLQAKTISVIPNLVGRLWKKKKIIEFREIKKIYNSPDTFSPLYRRFVIRISLKNSLRIRMLSVQLPETANELCQALLDCLNSSPLTRPPMNLSTKK